MPLIRECYALVRDTGVLWLRFLPQLGTWLALGWLGYTSALMGSAVLGNGIISMVVFALGITAAVVGQILAIASLKAGLVSIREFNQPDKELRIPETLFNTDRRVDVAIATIGPVLGVYALWEMLDDMVRDGFFWNAVIRTFGDTENWSVSFKPDLLPSYLLVGAVAFGLRLLYGRVVRDRSASWRLPLLVFEGLWAFSTFFAFLILLRLGQNWMLQRKIWRDGVNQWHNFLSWLPEFKLPYGWSLPQFLARSGDWIVEDFFPALWQGVALPLVWLAVTAIVLGWGDFKFRDLLPQHAQARLPKPDRPANSFEKAALFATTDLREKYLPLLHALRLVWHAGPYLLGSYVMLFAVLRSAEKQFRAFLVRYFTNEDSESLVSSLVGIDAVAGLLFGSISCCLWVAAFDRGLAAALSSASAKVDPPVTVVIGEN